MVEVVVLVVIAIGGGHCHTFCVCFQSPPTYYCIYIYMVCMYIQLELYSVGSMLLYIYI